MEANIFDVADDMSFPWLPAYAEAIEQQQQHLQPSSPLLSSVGTASGGCTQSRMLETIVEETSSDDDADGSRSGSRSRQSRPRTSEGDCCGGNGWSQYDQVWSSGGSDTGSVIRVDTPSDQDAMSERDYICPPKRRRQDQQDLDGTCSNSGSSSSNNSSNEELFNGGSTGELTVIVTAPPNTALTTNGGYYGGIGVLRKARYCELDQHQLQQQQQNLDVNEYFMRRHNEPRLRFDEIGHDLFTAVPPGGPDSDSLSYASLSRSSSLIQFESLERQLQNELQAASVGSGSVPSLTTIDVGGAVSGVGSANVGGVEGFYGGGTAVKKSLVAASKLKVGGGVVNGKQSQPVLNTSDSELYSSSASSGGDSSGGSSCNYASDECDLNQHTVSPSSEESGRVTKGSSSDEADGPVQQLLLVRACPQRCSERRLNRQNAAKNSIESLSEDSGYCDHLHFNMNNLRVRSKSLTNFGGSADNVNMFMEPTPVDFYERHVSFQENRLSTVCDVDEEEEEQQQQQVTGESNKYEHPGWYGAKTNIHNCTKIDLDASKQQQQQPFVVQTKVMPTSSSSSSSSSSTSPTSSQNASTDSLERPISSTDLDRHQPKPKNSNHRDEHASRKRPRTVISASSPDLFGVHAGSQVLLRRKQQSRKTSNDLLEFSVSSVPECLNLCGGEDFGHQSESLDSLCESATSSGNYCSWNVPQEASVASKNFDLYDFREQEQEAKVVVKKVTFQAVKPRVNIRASYANLTVLDYSDEEDGGRQYYLNRNTFRTSSGTRLGGVREMAKREEDEERLFPVDGDEKNVFNSLLDEISAHFDRNLSIINDQAEAYEPIAAFLHEQRSAAGSAATTFSALVAPPQPPPRRTQIKTNPHHSQSAAVTTIVVTQPDVKKRTFDQDPTNLVTCYAASLERCTFDPSETSLNRYDSKSSELNQPRSYAPVKREFVASTPNLNYYYSGGGYGDCEEGLHNSLKNVSCLEIGSRSTGILATASSSKCGLSKGVSFCPIVSEIIWKDNSSELDPDDNASVISNQDFEIDIDDEDFDQDDAEHASLTQTNTLLNANSIETGLCELINTPHPSSTDYHHQRTDNHHTELRLPTMTPERSPRENGDVTASLSQERLDDRKRDGHSCDVNNAPTPTLPDVSLESTLSNEVIIAEDRTETTMASAIANGDASKNLIAAESAPNTSDDQQVQGAAAATPPKFVNNNNNLIKNFKNGKAEKKGKTFLSRLSSGFRFSFRGKGKKNKDGGGVTGKTGNSGGAIAGRSDKQQQNNEKVSADFIYIPLKDPAAKQGQQSQSNGINNGEIAAAGSEFDDEEHYLRQMNTVGLEDCANDEPDRVYDPNETDLTFRSDSTSILNSTATSQAGNTASAHKNHVLSGKPPLPKQPPRVVGVSAKRSTPVRAHAQTRASSTPPRTEIDPEDDGEGYYRQYAAETAADSSRTSVGGRRYRANSTQSGPGAAAATAGDNYFNHIMGSEQKIGLIETNLDTHETVISGKTRSLMELGGGGPLSHQLQVHQVVISGNNSGGGVKVNGIKDHRQTAVNGNGVNEPGRPHKSMEFLLDKENQRNVLPPENELQKSHETGTNLSEHQLRVQASLQRLNIPDWYKQYSGKDGQPPNSNNTPQGPGAPGTGTGTGILRKRNSDVGRWTGLSSKTTSLSSLGSHRSDRSPVMLSPSAHSHHGGQTGFSRWSTSHLNSNQTSPSVSTRGSFTRGGLNASVISGYSTASTTVGATAGAPGAPGTIRNSFRQPYLGWRSQEKLSQPRTPAERLASSLLSQQKAKEQQQQAQNHNLQQKSDPVVTPEIQSSIKEVTSAIVHYVNDQTNRHSRSRSTSPSQRCWLESSFVGTRPLDSPQTPMIDGTQQQQHQQQSQLVAGDHYRYNAGRMNGVGESTLI